MKMIITMIMIMIIAIPVVMAGFYSCTGSNDFCLSIDDAQGSFYGNNSQYNLSVITNEESSFIGSLSDGSLTLIVGNGYEEGYTSKSIESAQFLPSSSFGTNATVNVNIAFGDDSSVSEVKFSLWDPNNNLIFNNLTSPESSGNSYNSTYHILNVSGDWRVRVNAKSVLGQRKSEAFLLSAGTESFDWEPLSSGNRIIYLASNSRLQDHSWETLIWQSSETPQNYSIQVEIDSSDFIVTSNISNPLIPQSTLLNPYIVNISIDTLATVTNGTYKGNVTFTRQVLGTKNVTYYQPFVLGISPPSGNLILTNTSGSVCYSDIFGTNCDTKLNITEGGFASVGFMINNTGGYRLGNCQARVIGSDFEGSTWWSSSLNDSFSVDYNTSKQFSIEFLPPRNTYGVFEGLIDVFCLEANDFGHNATAQSQPRVILDINRVTGGGELSGGGAGEEGPPPAPIFASCTENEQCASGICDLCDKSSNYQTCVTSLDLKGNGCCEDSESIITSQVDCGISGKSLEEIFGFAWVRNALILSGISILLLFLLAGKNKIKINKKSRSKKSRR